MTEKRDLQIFKILLTWGQTSGPQTDPQMIANPET